VIRGSHQEHGVEVAAPHHLDLGVDRRLADLADEAGLGSRIEVAEGSLQR
jgi:hypothetical protein